MHSLQLYDIISECLSTRDIVRNREGEKGAYYVEYAKCIYIYLYTVGPRLSEHLCATSMLSVQINEFVRISELSDKTHYLAS